MYTASSASQDSPCKPSWDSAPTPPLGLGPMLTWGPSFGGCWPEGGWAALGRQGLP